MADTEAKPVEVADPPLAPVAQLPEDKANDSKAQAEEKPVKEPTTEENGTSKERTTKDNDTKDNKAEDTTVDDGKPSIFRPPPGMLRVTGYRKNRETNLVKSDPASLAETDNPREIRKQVEFYFGDSNLPEDKFLWGKVGGEENKPVPLSLVCNFSRMRRFKPYEAVVKALKESNFFVIDGPEGEETIRRKNAVDLEKRTKREERSVYVKGFGDETKSTQFDVEAFFAQYGQFDSVRLRRDVEDPEKPFKGSVFVEWSDKDTAEKFMNQDPQPQWHGHPLNILWKLDYMRQKNEAIRDGKINSRGPRGRGNHRGQRGNARGNDRGADKNDWKKRRDQDQQNGFNDRRGNNRGGRDRGGRGRGRGRGNFRGRGGRDNQGDRDQDAPVKPADDGRPKIHVSKEGAKIMEQEKAKSGETNGKRARDEDASAGSPPAKKVDTKV